MTPGGKQTGRPSLELLSALARTFPSGVQVIPASALDRHNLRAEWALCVVADAPLPWDLLERRYPASHRVRVVSGEAERATTLAQARGESPEILVLEPLGRDADLADYASVPRLTERLRARDGCPWDREQTHASLRPYLIEETYEVADAIDDGDLARLREELGDLLLQIALHAEIASEEGAFDMGEVTRRLAEKLVRRHPHVFAGEAYAGEGHLRRWEELKREEREGTRADIGAQGGEREEAESALAGVPRSLPALFMAERLLERVERVGVRTPPDQPDGLGERLFAIVAEARRQGRDAEQALRAVNRRFAERFERFEALARLNGRELPTLTAGEVASLWEQAR